jgi:hypothetical protein
MEQLMALAPVHSPEANEQALKIIQLMQQAAARGETSIRYTTKNIHPLVKHVLVSKGYKVDDVTNLLPNGTRSLAFYVEKTYLITI